jgi:transcriptional regulatory protein GAL4
MDAPRPGSSHADSSSLTSLGASDQACNECKRRKGRCDRQLPECGPCARNKRHCLYERHSKTPLTRRYLTEVETRLRQTELRLKNAELRASLAESQLRRSKDVGQHGRATSSVQNDAFTSHDSTTSYGSATLTADNNFAALPHSDVPLDATVWSNVQHSTGTASDWPRQPEQALSHELEQPPSGPEDFSWDEQQDGCC